MVYSIAGGHQARIIHAFVESDKMVVLKSDYVTIWRDRENDTKLYLRWMLNDPIGELTNVEEDLPDEWDYDPHPHFPFSR